MGIEQSVQQEMDHIRDTFHKMLFQDEKLRAVSYAEYIGLHPDNGLYGIFGVSHNFLALTDWRVLDFNYGNNGFTSHPYETSMIKIQKQGFGKKLFLLRHFTQQSASLEASPMAVYKVEKKFIEAFERISVNSPKIPLVMETTTTVPEMTQGNLMHKCQSCGTLNWDRERNSASPYKDLCMGCLRTIKL